MRISRLFDRSVVGIAVTLVACGVESGSKLKRDDTQVDHTSNAIFDDHPSALSLAAKVTCKLKALVVLVGNGEPMGQDEFWSLNDVTRNAVTAGVATNVEGLQASVVKADEALRDRSLTTTECAQADSTGEVLFLSITDGPSQGDSAIRTTAYVWETVDGRKNWKKLQERSWRFQGGELAEGTGAFEMNIAAAMSPIVNKFAKLDPKNTGNAVFGSTVYYDQIAYILKGHGGRVTMNPADVPNRPEVQRLRAGNTLRHVFMFDVHGENGAITSPLYAPYWNQAEGGDSGTAGGDEGSAGIDESTAGIDESTAGIDESTAGAGKGVLFVKTLADPRATGLAEAPGGARFLGAAASYDIPADSIEGVSALDLPIGNSRTVPTLVLLDSCYGSDAILKALRNSSQGNVVVMTNPRPLYYGAIAYDALSVTRLLSMPYIIVQGLSASLQQGEFKATAGSLVDHLARGLDRVNPRHVEESYLKLQTTVFVQGRRVFSNQ